MKIKERLADVNDLVSKLEKMKNKGWNYKCGLSKHNSKSRYDDVIAKDIYEKTFEGGLNYKVAINRFLVRNKKSLSSLPDICEGQDVDNTYFYELTGIESLNGVVLSNTSQNVISENPYLESLRVVVNTISYLENNSKVKGNKNGK